jgi:hypothetical protein
VLAAEAEAAGLWPFALPLLFMVRDDPAAALDAERFSKAEPDGMGIAQKLTAPTAPLSAAVLAAARAFRVAAAQQPPLPPDKQPLPPPERPPRALHVVCQQAGALVELARKDWVT